MRLAGYDNREAVDNYMAQQPQGHRPNWKGTKGVVQDNQGEDDTTAAPPAAAH